MKTLLTIFMLAAAGLPALGHAQLLGGGQAQNTVYDKLQPLFQIHAKVCKPVANAAVLAWNAKRKGVLRRKWIRGIARSIGRQAELAVVQDFNQSETESKAFSDLLAMREFMGELVNRIYRPDDYPWGGFRPYFGQSELVSATMCGWIAAQCSAMVSGPILDYAYSEEAHRIRFALDRWHSTVVTSLAEVRSARRDGYESGDWTAWEALTSGQVNDVDLVSEHEAPYDKCVNKLGTWPAVDSDSSAPQFSFGTLRHKAKSQQPQADRP